MSTWGKDLQTFQSFSMKVLTDFFLKNGYTDRQKTKGYQFFTEGYLHDVLTCGASIKAKCYKSQKKSEKPHTLCINFKNDENEQFVVEDAHCSCAAGASQSCNHLVGLGYLIQDMILRELKEIPEDTTCTSKPMQWNVPRGPKIEAEKILGKSFYNPLNTNRKRAPITCTITDALREGKFQKIHTSEVQQLQVALQKHKGNIPMTYLLTGFDRSIENPTEFEFPKNSLLHHRLYGNNSETNTSRWRSDMALQLPLLETDMSLILQLQPPVKHDSLEEINFEEASKLEEQTREQGSKLWHDMRIARFTASNFGYVCKRKLFNMNFANKFLKSEDLKHVAAVQHGLKNESVAIKKFLEEYKDVTVFKCGLVIHPYATHLGASPDGIIEKNGNFGILEIKCPASKNFGNLKEACQHKDFILQLQNENIIINKTHDYYYQMQGQMLLTGLKWGCLVIYFKTGELHVQEVAYDPKFCENMYNILTNVYVNKFLPLCS